MIFKEKKKEKKNVGSDYPFRTNQHTPSLEEKNVEGVQWHDKKMFFITRVSCMCSSKAANVLARATFIKNKVFIFYFYQIITFPHDQIITTTKTLWITQTAMKPRFKNFDNKDNWVIILCLKSNKLKMIQLTSLHIIERRQVQALLLIFSSLIHFCFFIEFATWSSPL